MSWAKSRTIKDSYQFVKRAICNCFCLGLALTIVPIFAQEDKREDQQQFQNPPNTQKLEIPMTPPEAALKMMELPEGFISSLFAAEPDVHQPIAVTTDARGRLWVAECYTYSDRKENFNTELNDRIVIFEDTDNDGKFDTRKVFWDKAKKLTSIEVGMGGVWITAAPNLMFIPDANRDDIPDGEPEILLDGFEGDVIRHNIVNGLRWGPDGWLYGRHGIQATSFVGPPGSTDSQRSAMNCAIWRFHPVSRKFEIVAQGGTNSWGFDYDEHGEMFMINTVIGHLFHVVPNARYRRMYGAHFNPHLYGVIEQTADHFHWDVSEEHWAVTKKEGMSDGTDAAGGGHAHTGLMIYQGGNWPKEFHNKLFTANFHGRRINSDSIHRQGNSFVSHHGSDYFKTEDPWFRGVEMIYGSDGGVFLLDWSDIGECHENDGIHRTSGRIFKITFGNAKLPEHSDLAKLSADQLIELLGNKNEWYSRKARRLLQERAFIEPASTVNLVKKLMDKYRSISITNEVGKIVDQRVKHQLRIMWALHSVTPTGADTDWLLKQTASSSEYIRAWAIRLLNDGERDLTDEVYNRLHILAATDKSGLVRLYIASSLPRFEGKWVFRIANALLQHPADANDRVQPKLIWFGIEPHIVGTSQSELPDGDPVELALNSKIPLVRRNIVRRCTNEIDKPNSLVPGFVRQLTLSNDRAFATDILEGMAAALHGWSEAPKPTNWGDATKKLGKFNDATINELVQQINIVFGDGRTTAELKKIIADNNADVATRRKAIAALAKSNEAPELFGFLKPHLNNKALTNAVAKALVRSNEPAAANAILGRFKNMDPEGRAITINTLVTRSKWAKTLLDNVANGKIDKRYLSAAHARQIMNMEDESLTQQLTEVWGEVRKTSAARQKEIDEYRSLLSQAGTKPDLENGQMLYAKNCASCHTLFGVGGKIGPDLTGSDRKNLNYLLENIVDPSASVAESYRSSIIELDDGRVLTGVIVSQNERVMEIQTKDDLVTIDRKTVEQSKVTKNSLMPEALLDELTEQQIADLFGFLAR